MNRKQIEDIKFRLENIHQELKDIGLELNVMPGETARDIQRVLNGYDQTYQACDWCGDIYVDDELSEQDCGDVICKECVEKNTVHKKGEMMQAEIEKVANDGE